MVAAATGGASLGSASAKILIDAAEALRTLSGVETALGRTQRAGGGASDSLGKAQRAAVGGGIAIVGMLGGAVFAAANFEAGMSGVAASLGGVGTEAGITEEQFQALVDTALRIGEDTSFSATEAVAALEVLGKAGASADDIINGLADASVNLAAATGESVPQSAALMQSAMAVFDLDVSKATDTTDTLTAALNASSIDMTQFSAGFRAISPLASIAGSTIEETSAAVAYFTKQGLTGADTGTSLARALTEMTNPDNADELRALGVEAYGADGKFVGFKSVADQLNATLGDLTPAERLTRLQTVFLGESIDVMAIAAREGGTELGEFEALMVPAGQAADQAAQRLDNTKGRFEEFKGALASAAIAIGNVFLPSVDKLIVILTLLVKGFNNLSGPMQAVIAVIGAVTSGLLFLLAGAIGVIQIASKFSGSWETLVKILKPVGNLLTKLRPILMILRFAIAGLNPPLLILIALIALFALAYKKNFLGFGDLVRRVLSEVRDFIVSSAEKIMVGLAALGTVVSILVNLLQGGLARALEFLSGPFAKIGDAIEWLSGIISKVATGFGSFVGTLTTAILGLVGVVVALAKGEWAEAWERFKEVVTTFGESLRNGFMTLVSGLASFLMSGLSSIGGAILDGLRSAFDFAKAGLSGLWSTLLDIGGDLLSAVTGADYGAIGTAIWDGIVAAVGSIKDLAELLAPKALELLNGFVTGLGTAWQNVVDWFSGWGSKLPLAIPLLTNSLFPKARALLNGFISGLDDAWDSVVNWFLDWGWKIPLAIPLLGMALAPKALALLKGFVSGLDDAWDTVVDWFLDWGYKIPLAIPLLGLALMPKARALLMGFISGLDDAWGAVSDWFVGIGTKIIAAIPLLGEILGPKAGALLRGFVSGLEGAWSTVTEWLGGIGPKILAAIPVIVDILAPKARALLRGFLTGLDEAWGTVSGWLGELGPKILAAVSGMLEILPGRGRELITGLFQGMYTTFRTVVEWVAGIGGKVVTAIGKLGKILKEAGLALIEGLLEGIEEGAEKVIGFVGGLAGKIKGAFTGGGDEKESPQGPQYGPPVPSIATAVEAVGLATSLESAQERITTAIAAIKTALGTVLAESFATFGTNAGAAFKDALDAEMVLSGTNVTTRLAELSPTFDIFIAAMGTKGTLGGTNFKTTLNAEMVLSNTNVSTRLSELSPLFDTFIEAMRVKGTSGGRNFNAALNAQMLESVTAVSNRLASMSPIFDVFVAAMGTKGRSGGTAFLTAITDAMNRARDTVTTNVSTMSGRLSVFASNAGVSGNQAGSGFLNGLRGGLNAAAGVADAIVGRIRSVLSTASSGAYGYGSSVGSQFAAGMNASLGAVSQAAANIRNLMPSSPAKRGPLSKPVSFAYIVEDLVANMRLLGPSARAGVGNITSALGAVSGAPFGVMPAYASASRLGGASGGGATVYNTTHEFTFPNATIQSKADAEGYFVEAMREVIATRGYALGQPAGGI